jgi:hypothetical protein
MRCLWFVMLVIGIIFAVQGTDACWGGGSSGSSSSSATANRFGVPEDGGNYQGQSVSVGVQCDSSGNCKKYEDTQTWG